MTIEQIVFKELFQRNSQLISSLIAVSLGIAVIVGIQSTNHFSEKAIAGELNALGANILILAKDATVQDYYSADFQQSEIPEDYVSLLAGSNIEGIENMSPKYSMPINLKGKKYTMTGILPKNEFKSKAIWEGALGGLTSAEKCDAPAGNSTKNKVRQTVINDLEQNEILVGADIASILNLKVNDSITILDKSFIVKSTLPATGTVDDGRVFAHLHTVQSIVGKSDVLHSIEIIGCCNSMSKGLVDNINKLLPDAKVVTISQIAQTQIKTNNVMKKISLIMLVVIMLVGGASIANFMFANVYERKREIGVYMAMGATSKWIVELFLLKALIIGLAGGVIGYVIGSVLAMILGPQIAGVTVYPLPQYAIYSIVISTVISLIASAIPSYKATHVDPSIIMKEN